ncbi:hypothetical protein D3C71_1711730 [compost metagenome]
MTMAEAKNTSSRVRHGPSCSGVCSAARAVWFCNSQTSSSWGPPNTPYSAYRPIPLSASSLITDSKAMANTRPSCFSRVAMWREPKKIVNRLISTQKANATRALTGSPVRMLIESATAWICRASNGSTPISMMTVVSAPAQVLRKRNASRSASEESW